RRSSEVIANLDLRPVFDVLEPAGADEQPGGFLNRRPQAVIVLLVMVEHPLDALTGFLDRLVRHAVADETHHFGIAINGPKGVVGIDERPPRKKKTICGENEHTFLPLDLLAYEESSQGHAPEGIGRRSLTPRPEGMDRDGSRRIQRLPAKSTRPPGFRTHPIIENS